jgi:TatD DNase family protein|uniref:TatD family deoxyribonuclease n=1 Tax=Desulfobacca acetoxidans TaxID=60893 RepID=A0A7V6DNZ4_9BACT
MIDGHAHLNEIEDVEGALARAREIGITGIVAVGMDIASNQVTLALHQRFHHFVHPAVGYHPWSITPEGVEDNLAFIRENLAGCVALGEVGLDYQAKVKKKLQQEVLAKLLELAARENKPVILHTRFSQSRTLRMIKEAGIARAVFHWYSGPLDILREILRDGYLISATPALAYSPPHQAAIQAAPLDRILIETDSPVVYQEEKSEPAHLVVTVREVSRLKGMELSRVIETTTANSRDFFNI